MLFVGVPVLDDRCGLCDLVSDQLITLSIFSLSCEGVSTVMNNRRVQLATQKSFEKAWQG